MIDWICSKHFVHDSWLRSSVPTNFDQDCSLNAGQFDEVLDWAFLLQEEQVTHYCTNIMRWPSAPKTETTTNGTITVPWSSKAAGGITSATTPTWTACTTTAITRLTLTAWTGKAGKATSTPLYAPRWRSGLAISMPLPSQFSLMAIRDAFCTAFRRWRWQSLDALSWYVSSAELMRKRRVTFSARAWL